MSVFSPMSFAGQPDRKKMLLDQLMQQYQQAASRAVGLEQAQSMGGAVGATPFHTVHPFGGMGLYTASPHVLPPGLAARLGPGAIGIPDPIHSGHGVSTHGPANPHGGGNPVAAGGASHPIDVQNPHSNFLMPNAPLGIPSAVSAADQIVRRRAASGLVPYGAGGRMMAI